MRADSYGVMMSRLLLTEVSNGYVNSTGEPSVRVTNTLAHPLPPIVRSHKHSVDGQTVQTLIDPSDGEVFAEVIPASVDDVDMAITSAVDVIQGEWGAWSAVEREASLHRFSVLVESNLHSLAELEALGAGRPVSALLKHVVPESVAWIRYLAGLPTKMDGNTGAEPGFLGPFRCSFRESRGVAVLRLQGVTSFTRRIIPIVSALAAGSTVILLCDDNAYPGLHFLCDLLIRAGVPSDAVSLLFGDQSIEQQLLIHDAAFIPNQESGCAAMPCSSRMLVFEDADIDQVVETLLTRVLSPLNPSVYAPRLHVHESIYEELIEAIEGRLKRLQTGPILNSNTDVGPLYCAEHYQQANEVIARCRKLGLRIVCGGERYGDGFGIKPTLIADDQLSLAHLTLTLPAPIIMVQPFGYEDRTVRRANRDRNCQGISLFTQQLTRIRQLSRVLHTEQIWVNSHYRMEPGDQYDPLGPYLRRRSLWVES